MKLDQFYYLIGIANYGSYSKASEALHITQQALSKSIQSLEKEYGIMIFQRSNQGCVLTEQGMLLLNFAQNTINAHENLLNAFQPQKHSTDQDITQINIFMVPSISMILPFILDDFKQQFPNIKIFLQEVTSFQVIDLLKGMPSQKGQYNLGLSIFYETPSDDKFLAQFSLSFIGSFPLSVWVHKSSPLASYQHVPLAALREYSVSTCSHSGIIDENIKRSLKSSSVSYNYPANNLALIAEHINRSPYACGIISGIVSNKMLAMHHRYCDIVTIPIDGEGCSNLAFAIYDSTHPYPESVQYLINKFKNFVFANR